MGNRNNNINSKLEQFPLFSTYLDSIIIPIVYHYVVFVIPPSQKNYGAIGRTLRARTRRPGAFPRTRARLGGLQPRMLSLPEHLAATLHDLSRDVATTPPRKTPPVNRRGRNNIASGSACPAQPRVQIVSQPVAKEIEGHNNDGNDETGEQCDPPRLSQKFPAFCNENSPRRVPRRQSQSQKAQ